MKSVFINHGLRSGQIGLARLLVAWLAILLAACGSAPTLNRSPESVNAAKPRAETTKSSAKTPQLPKANSGKGAYYQDDGPGDNPPPNLESTVDPIPMVEPFSRSGNKPYVVFGKTYTPITDPNTPFKQRGLATWYGKKFHGQKTSSGELYDMFQVTAAHPTLPIPSYARLTNLENGKQIIVRINDRGPFHSTRIIDLSYTAALKLGYLEKGSSQIEVERLLPDDIERMAENRKNQIAPIKPSANAVVAPGNPGGVVSAAINPTQATDKTLDKTQENPQQSSLDAWFAEQEKRPVETISAAGSVSTSGYYIQVGAYAIRANAEATLAHLKERLANRLPDFDIVQQGNLYRLITGPFKSRNEASSLIAENKELNSVKALVIQR